MIKLRILLFCIAFMLTFITVSAKVLELDERFLTVEKEGTWLVMFYAPWCGHCKKLEPTWLEVGAALNEQKSGVHVARIDATRYSNLAGHYQIRGFPTIVFFKKGQRIDYHGARSKPSIISFVNRAKGPAVTELNSQNAFLRTKQAHDVFFMYVGAETPLKELYTKVAQRVFTIISLYSGPKTVLPHDVSMNDEAAILVFKDGKYYQAPNDLPDDNILRAWLLSEQFPSYNHLTGSSFQLLRAAGRRYAVSVTDKNDPLNNTLHLIALQRKFPYTFCWTKGNAVINSITYGTIAVPNLVVFDARSHEYYVLSDVEDPTHVTEALVTKFFDDIKAGSLEPKGGNGIMQQMKRAMGDFVGFFIDLFTKQPIVAAVVVLVPTLLISCFCFCLCSISDDEDPSSEYEDSDFEDNVDETKGGDVKEESENRDSESIQEPDAGDEPPMEGLRQRVKEGTKTNEE